MLELIPTPAERAFLAYLAKEQATRTSLLTHGRNQLMVMADLNKPKTPWEKVCAKFNMSLLKLSRLMNRDFSAVHRSRVKCNGCINHNYQLILIKLAKAHNVNLRPEDLLPEF